MSDEALRLLEEFVKQSEWKVGCYFCTIEVNGDGDPQHQSDCPVAHARAFLANIPETAAREAVYREALEKAKSSVWEALSHIEHSQTKSLAHLHGLLTKTDEAISPVLAAPSPAAAALLARGEERQALRSELLEMVEGDDSTLADQIRDLILNLDEGILADGAALAPGEAE